MMSSAKDWFDPEEIVARRLAAIVESSDDAIISKTLNGAIVTWNAGAARVFGYDAEEIIGRPVTLLIPPDRLGEEAAILARIRRGERIEHYETVRQRKDGGLIDISLTISPILDETGQVVGASKIARDITARKSAERKQELLLEEIKHRVKNTLGIVQAIANQTFAGAPAAERSAFGARLRALGEAHDLLTQGSIDSAEVSEIVATALAPFRAPPRERFDLAGPAQRIGASNAMLLALVLHELATNAVKYGALSKDFGHVILRWNHAEAGRNTLRFVWREEGGPAVTAPAHKGFGSKLIQRALAGADSQASIEFLPGGVVCSFELKP